MPQNQERLAKLLGKAVNQLVTSGDSVRIDGLGTFVPGADGDPDFLPDTDARIFIAYSKEDVHHADRLYEDLLEAGFNPWLDHKKLLAGQNWARSIDRAIETSDFFVACYSSQSTVKRGRFQSEVRTALRCSDEMPLDDLFFIPVRLDECRIPERIATQFQQVDLFPDWRAGLEELKRSLQTEWWNRIARGK